MEDLSPRQRDVLDFISAAIAQRGLPPTYREIGDALNIRSTNGVADHVKALIRKGYIKKLTGDASAGLARGLQLTGAARSTERGAVTAVPIVGTVAAGTPIMAEENYDRTLHIDSSLVPSGGVVFGLKVRGDSMIEEGIHDGDIVIVRQQSTARDGDIVVALVDGSATVKFYFRERGRIRLQPAHPTMAPIFVDPTMESAVQGLVVGVYRNYN